MKQLNWLIHVCSYSFVILSFFLAYSYISSYWIDVKVDYEFLMLDFPLLYLRFYMFYGRNGLLLLNAMLRIKISVIELKYVNEQLLFILPFQSDECFINLLQTSEKANPSCFKWNIYDFRLFIWNLVQNIHVYAVSILNIKNRCSAKWSPR